MTTLELLNPYVRVGHYYRFPVTRNQVEVGRIGYCYAFHFVAAGKGSVSVGGKTYPVKKGDLIYFPPEAAHSFYTNSDHPLATYNLYCDLWNYRLASTQHLVWDLNDFNRDLLTVIEPCSELSSLPVVTPIQHDATLCQLFIYAVTQVGKSEPYSELIVSHLVKAFLLTLVQTASVSTFIDYRIIPIIEQMDREANASRSYDDWMNECGLRKTQFHELFKQATGSSPKAYWTKAIMKQVEAALWESNRSITTIAEDFGYSSVHHFTKQFTQFHGLSPTEFRRLKK
ncbi:AraC family transcriptional regulator [Paenibacillus roseipurpureus]|uniref:AraC family transcriptional regulator n=1 Tax=Paenibacillus roseopurpureus TaxID=2918901 RepID=A0AA96LMJ5_9BACL|nr:AraC family transcriptional regulator [Paenibacillus sp. MBLB1832]WNR43857.1 AraC family transcriptional regulator [Paenibacillus sp. MBLB1832]